MSAPLAGGERLRATVTDRTYRVLSVNAETDTARVLARGASRARAGAHRTVRCVATVAVVARGHASPSGVRSLRPSNRDGISRTSQAGGRPPRPAERS